MADRPDPVDVYVGQMIRARRKMAGASQEGLAKAVGVTFQQVQKYERGDNRVSASRLARIARYLSAPIEAFFPEVDEEHVRAGIGPAGELAGVEGGLALAIAYLGMDHRRRQALLRVASVLTDADAEEPGRAYVNGGDEEARHVAG